jgi:hypothetical protein
MVDQRVFELACGGVLVAILTLGTVAKISIFSKTVPEQGNTTNIDQIVFFCREGVYPTQLCRNSLGEGRDGNNPPCQVFCCIPCGTGLLFYPIMILLGFAPVIAIVFGEYSYDIWNQVTSLQALPEDVACPMLWKDPLADYVFWLA